MTSVNLRNDAVFLEQCSKWQESKVGDRVWGWGSFRKAGVLDLCDWFLNFDGDINSQETGQFHNYKSVSKTNMHHFIFSTLLDFSCHYRSQ